MLNILCASYKECSLGQEFLLPKGQDSFLQHRPACGQSTCRRCPSGSAAGRRQSRGRASRGWPWPRGRHAYSMEWLGSTRRHRTCQNVLQSYQQGSQIDHTTTIQSRHVKLKPLCGPHNDRKLSVGRSLEISLYAHVPFHIQICIKICHFKATLGFNNIAAGRIGQEMGPPV